MKNQKVRFFLMALATFVSLGAQAGADKGGNGGKGVYCDLPNGTRKLFLLDYARKYGDSYITPTFVQGKNEIEKALNLVKRIEAFDPLRAASYEAKIVTFLDPKNIETVAHLSDEATTPDSHEQVTCVNPKTVQIIIQYTDAGENPWGPQKNFVLDESRWNDLDSDQKAGLILHEIILSELIMTIGSTDPIMWFNAQIAANSLQSLKTYTDVRKAIGLADWTSLETIKLNGAARVANSLTGHEPSFMEGIALVVIPKSMIDQVQYIVPKHPHLGSPYASYSFSTPIKPVKINDCNDNNFRSAEWQKQVDSLKDEEGIQFFVADRHFNPSYGPDSICIWGNPITVRLAP